MKKYIAIAAALTCLAAQAQQAPVRFFGSVGGGFGGDELASGSYTNGNTFSIKAGNGFTVSGGVSVAVSSTTDVQVSVGYESASTNASNGDISFTRLPIEVLGFYTVSPQWRVGGGLRSATSPKLSTSGVAGMLGSYEFTPSVGVVLEAQYLFDKSATQRGQFGISGRYVGESFEEKTSKTTINGNHVGVALVFYY